MALQAVFFRFGRDRYCGSKKKTSFSSCELKSDSTGLVVQWDRASGQGGRIFLWPYKPRVD